LPVLRTRARLFALLALAAVAVVNAAGLMGIRVARRGAVEEAARLFRSDSEARARALESRLSATRADLAFLAGSAPVQRLRTGRGEGDDLFRRQAAESALLLFLRAHPEVVRLAVNGPTGQPLLLTGRRGGVPVLWVSSSPTGSEGAAHDPGRPRVVGHIAFAGAEGTGADAVEVEIAPSLLLASDESLGDTRGQAAGCRLEDAQGKVLARSGASGPVAAGAQLSAEASVAAEGWSSATPWRYVCTLSEEAAVASVEPLSARYRTTLYLNLAVMGLALLLGGLAAREALRRERSEARAREEARVRELERRLFHAERLTTVGRLAAGIAHEINNPLEGMANYLSLARDALVRGDVEGARRRLDGVREGLERAAQVVRQVLAHADPDRAPRSPIDLARVLEETTEFVRSRKDFGGIRFETALPPRPLLVEGSRIMLGQVAVNLVLNACEAQEGTGEVQVSARREGPLAVAEVADRGPGVPEGDRQRIFEPFFSTKDSTGLGLSVCHSIVKQHGGDLVALAREGGGAVFRLTLPASAAETEAA
jgi:signal transduction histidine kinase